MGEQIQPRTFRDEQGKEWEVRAIKPATKDRRAPVVRSDLANGWLLFTVGLERRRLAPLPSDWREATEDELNRLCKHAERVEVRLGELGRARRARP
jgi:hypothetical protein